MVYCHSERSEESVRGESAQDESVHGESVQDESVLRTRRTDSFSRPDKGKGESGLLQQLS